MAELSIEKKKVLEKHIEKVYIETVKTSLTF